MVQSNLFITNIQIMPISADFFPVLGRRKGETRDFIEKKMEPLTGFEPMTYSLRMSRSTN
jgi:hypothetical protein